MLKHRVTQADMDSQSANLNTSLVSGTVTSSTTSKTVTGVGSVFLLDVLPGETLAIPGTGMLTTTERSPIVTGFGTTFTTEVTAGDVLVTLEGNEIGVVASITSNTVLTLTANALVVDEDIDAYYEIGKVKSVENGTSLTLKTRAKRTVSNATNVLSLRGQSVLSVTRVFPLGVNSNKGGLFGTKFQIGSAEIMAFVSGGMGGLASYATTRQYLNTLQFLLDGEKVISFSQSRNIVKIQFDWSSYLEVGSIILFEANIAIDPENSGLFNDQILRDLATAYCKKQFGQNLSKFNGVILLGGTTLNGTQIFSEALAEIAILEERLRNEYSYPPQPIVG